MALINQQTDLKSLRFGSEEPYVTKNINNPPDNSGVLNQVNKRVDDLTRITKLLVDKPGLKFAANQAFVRQEGFADKINKRRTEDGNTTGGAILRQVGSTAVGVAKVIGSTLAQVPVNGTGTHFVQGFRTDTYLQDSEERSDFAQFFGAGGVEGAPFALRGEKVPTGNIKSNFPTGIIQGVGDYNDRYNSGSNYINKVLDLSLDTQDTTLRGSTGNQIIPINNGNLTNREIQSTLVDRGTGLSYNALTEDNKPIDEDEINTNIISAKSGNPINISRRRGSPFIYNEIKDTTAASGSLNSRPNTDNGIYNSSSVSTISPGEAGIQDFRNPNAVSGSNSNTYSFNYNSSEINKETRLGLGNQGKKVEIDPNEKYTKTNPESIDRVNQLGVLDSRPSSEDSRDLISLNFQVLTPETTKYLYFRAYLDSFSDSFNADWGTTKYLGRAENMYTYNGFDRAVSLGFKIAASTREEMQPIYEKVNYLASTTAPTYGDGTFMRGTLVKITVGDYLYEVPAVINSVQYSWQTDYPWEISMNNPESGIDDDMQVLPHILDCSVELSIINNFIPQTGKVPFVSNPFGNSFGKRVWTSLPSQGEVGNIGTTASSGPSGIPFI